MMKYIFREIESEVQELGESIERMEIDTDDFTSIYIKIEPSTRIDNDFYLVGTGNSLKESLKDILTNQNGLKALINEVINVEAEFVNQIQDKREQKQWYESQI